MVLSSISSTIARAASQDRPYEILLFPSAHIEVRPDADESDHKAFELEIASGAVYSWKYKNFRNIGEAYISNHEMELERLQFGRQFPKQTLLWLGRLHTPLGFWNSEYHHGLHLQSSVHRPGIVEYEDAGGILPNHVIGMLLRKNQNIGSSIVNVSFAFGSAAKIKDRELSSFNLDFESGFADSRHLTARIYFQPDELDELKYGIFYSQSTIPTDTNNLDKVRQKIFGAYTYQNWLAFNLTAATYYVNNDLNFINKTQESNFLSNYIHLEYEVTGDWMLYTRWEFSKGADNDAYLKLLDHDFSDKILGGVRLDFTRRQAISSEISRRSIDDDTHAHISIQWSAIFP